MSHEQPNRCLPADPRTADLAAARENVLVANRRGNRTAAAGAIIEGRFKDSALLLSGVPAQRLAASGRFEAAERLILSRAWMEKYKPESLRFIRAGVLYEHGEEAAAGELLRNINPSDLSEGEAREYEVLLEALGPGQT